MFIQVLSSIPYYLGKKKNACKRIALLSTPFKKSRLDCKTKWSFLLWFFTCYLTFLHLIYQVLSMVFCWSFLSHLATDSSLYFNNRNAQMNYKYRVRSFFFILFLHVPILDNSVGKLQQSRPTERAACISVSQVTILRFLWEGTEDIPGLAGHFKFNTWPLRAVLVF